MNQILKKGASFMTLVLIVALALTACQGPVDPGTLNTEALQASIDAANTAKEGVAVNTLAANVPLGTQWVTQAEMGALTIKITAAETARDSATTQAAIDNVKTSLDNAVTTFNAAKKGGTGTPVDKSELVAEIAKAEQLQQSVVVSASADEVASGVKWVTQEVMTTFTAVITAAKTARDSASTQATIDTAKSTLTAAISVFTTASQNGTKSNGFTPDEMTALISRANTTKNGVQILASGSADDVAPGAEWILSNNPTVGALEAAITSAGSANDDNRDDRYNALVTALNNFTAAVGTGTIPDKTGLNNAIQAADAARTGVEHAANAAAVPLGSQWATDAQFAALATPYNNAVTITNTATATQAQVNTAITTLQNATSAFTQAVNSNGLGTKQEEQKAVTITGLPTGVTEVQLSVLTTNNTNDIVDMILGMMESDESSIMVAYGEGYVANRNVTVPLETDSGPWMGEGTLYVGLLTEEGVYVSKNSYNFAVTTNPSIAFSTTGGSATFKQIGYPVRLADLFGMDFTNKTLNELMLSEGPMSYDDFITQEYGGQPLLYKDAELNQHYVGTDRVSSTDIVYSKTPIMGGDDRGAKVGEITGSISITNIPNNLRRVRVQLEQVSQQENTWWSSSSGITLSGTSNQNVNWNIPVYERDVDGYKGSNSVRLRVRVELTNGCEFELYSSNGPFTLNSLNSDHNLGSAGTVSLASITLSGTVNVTYNGLPVPRLQISALPNSGRDFSGDIELTTPGANAPWTIAIPDTGSAQNIRISVYGYTGGNNSESLFRNSDTIINNVSSTQTGINITLGDISSKIVTGTITLTNVPANLNYAIISLQETSGSGNLWYSSGSDLNVNSGSSAQIVPWSISLNDGGAGPFEGTKEVRVRVYATLNNGVFLDVWVPGTYNLTYADANLGSVGVVSLAHIILSGTVSVTYNGQTVPNLRISAFPDGGGNSLGYTNLSYPAPGATWEMAIPYLPNSQTVNISVDGYGENWGTPLVSKYDAAQVADVYNTNKSGINLNLGNITD
ncbi:hypothetical protein AGMMS50293_29940 [Spirochaetia bacterium]|nr:hypothetical protein AGMMS50293_29940 [Spirochaetia bacterium]